MDLLHFSHEHPLIFEEEYKDDGRKVSCYGCQQQISGPCYFCKQCEHFLLHKVCAELPREMEHPMHEHPLNLLPSPPNYSQSPKLPTECAVCRQLCESFTYNCSLCKFDIHIMCALMVHKIKHECHDHPLTPLQRPSLFLCDACGTRHEGTSYKCSTCKFWVNQKCASLPRTIRFSHHDHPLSLTYSFPFERFRFTSYCCLCNDEEVQRVYWAYCCADCKYFAHVNCLRSKPELCSFKLSEEETTKEETREMLPPRLQLVTKKPKSRVENAEPDLILPPPEESLSLIQHFVKKIGLLGKNKKSTMIYHVRHHHPLFFVDKHINDESSASRKLIPCDACAQPVLAPFYHCNECDFVLHECCAKIPIELQHPIHPNHPLLLNRWWQYKCSGQPICQGCNMSCNGVLYGCVACDFFLDLNCASLLGNIKHKAHPQHVLTLKETTNALCNACHGKFCGVGLVCAICKFSLHIRCALLPPTVGSKYDRHPFSLLYFGTDDDYYCEICEKEINLNCWFYNCGDCRRSLHTKCICPVGSLPLHFIKHEAHEHTLALRETGTVRCAACKHKCYGFGFVCKENCDFTLHPRCASLPPTLEHRKDVHPYILTYSGERGYNYCVMCQTEINDDYWFYHCAQCGSYLHTLCTQFVEHSKWKIGAKVNLGCHQHLLTVVEHPKVTDLGCNSCGEHVKDWCLECEDCTDFVLHKRCAYNEANKLISSLQKGRRLTPQQDTSRWNASPKMMDSATRERDSHPPYISQRAIWISK